MDQLPQKQPTTQSPAASGTRPAASGGVLAGAVTQRPWYRSKKVWSLVAVLLVLLGIGTFVPAGKLPFLRQLVYAMGYSYEEGQRTSFLKALLSWNERRRIMRGELPDPDEASVFGAAGGAFNALAGKAQNKLIDVNTVNAALAKRGQKTDALAGSYNDPVRNAALAGGENPNDPAVRIQNQNVSANTQANAAQNAAVFFGEDSSLIQRDKNDGYNSVNTLKKVTAKPLAGFGGSDWLGRLADKAIRSETNLTDFAKSMDRSSTALAKFGDISDIGDSRAKRDLFWAVLMGRAGRRTPQIPLKKTLAAAGFDGAELPRSVFTSSGFSGVGINAGDVLSDLEDVQTYLDQDKTCQDAAASSSSSYDLATINQQIAGITPGAFPATCADVGGSNDTYMATLTGLENSCNQMKSAYERVQQKCGTLSFVLDDNQCHSVTLSSYYTQFTEECQRRQDACQNAEDVDACMQEAAAFSSSQDYGDGFNVNNLEADRNALLYTTTSSGETRFNTDFFPGVNWNNGRPIKIRSIFSN